MFQAGTGRDRLPHPAARMDVVAGKNENREIEIKLPLPDAAQGRRLLRRAGFRVSRRRVFEENILYDTEDSSLRKAGSALRLRRSGKREVLTFKGPCEPGKHKSREELEMELVDRKTFEAILTRLGFRRVFRYEKHRTEYSQARSQGTATLDETPVGVFFELEGSPQWIDRTARALGFSEADYITAGYVELNLRAAGDRESRNR
jgi:adenylate cyclase, class 2